MEAQKEIDYDSLATEVIEALDGGVDLLSDHDIIRYALKSVAQMAERKTKYALGEQVEIRVMDALRFHGVTK